MLMISGHWHCRCGNTEVDFTAGFSYLSKAPCAHTVTGIRWVGFLWGAKSFAVGDRNEVPEPWQSCCQVTHNPALLTPTKCLLSNKSNFKRKKCLHTWRVQTLEQNTVASRYGLTRVQGGTKRSGCFFGSICWNNPAGRAIAGEELTGRVTWGDPALSDKADVFCRALGNDRSWTIVADVSPSSLQGDQISLK